LSEPGPRPVLIYAVYPALRAGLIALLDTDPSLAPTGPELHRSGPGGLPSADHMIETPPAAIVIDLGGIDDAAFDDIADAYPGVPQVLIGADPNLDGPGLGAGAVAYLGPEVDGPMLIAAVHGVLAGLTIVDPVIAGQWLQPTAPVEADIERDSTLLGIADPLTDRERQVLELVASGLPNKAIARELGISEHTVKFHVGSLLGKLSAGSRTEAVTIATRRGLLTI
jgi:DNA-binding NarL/FixJ family response regulator